MARIAVIEDDASLSRLMREALGEEGHQVLSYVQPGIDTIEHLKAIRPDLVIIDANLTQQLSGWDLIERIKEEPELAGWPLMLSTGDRRAVVNHHELLERYHIPVLAKPFDIEQLEGMVAEALAG